MDVVWALVALVAAVHAGYALWTARRLDRLHRRVDAAAAALDDRLRDRAAAALATAPGPTAPRPPAALARAATAALAVGGLGQDREHAENALSRALGDADSDAALAAAISRAGYARAFYNDTVRDALVVRRRRIVRAFRLSGSARLPTFFEMDEPVAARRTIEV
jgi:hypothetical protein